MSEPKQSLEEALFELAAQKPAGPERAAFLDGVCRDQPALRARLDLLLEGFDGGPGFLKQAPERPPLAAVPAVESPAPQIGRFKLLERLGEGGFGEVWMAEQREPVKRRVALKLIKPGMDSRQVVARFEAERQALALMDHPNIARVFDAGTTDLGRPYFVMELVRGVKITDYCDQTHLSTRQRLDLFIQVCKAVQHAHQKGIIHRDIKPSNILVTLHDGVPVPKVIDFGIAKATQGELTDMTVFTQFQQFIGTPAYVSPEQAEMSGLDIDTRADIYSLGVLLYELLVGQTPFDAREMMRGGLDGLRRIILEGEPPRPSTKLDTLPGKERTTAGRRRQTDPGALVHQIQGDLDWIVMKCLEKDRNRRYETANGLAADLQRHLANEPVAARPPSAAYRIQKAWQRNKLVCLAAVAVSLALLVGTAVSVWQAGQATRARNAETRQRQLAQAKQREAEEQRQLAQQSDARTGELLYAATLNLVQSSFEQSNIPLARRLLEQTHGYADPGFEWFYWQRELRRATRVLRGHAGEVRRVAFSPDDQLILTGGEDEVILLRDLANGEERLRLDGVAFEHFSPDGQRLLCRSRKEGLQIFSAATGRKVLTLGQAIGGVFSPDGTRVAAARGERVILWDSITGQEWMSFKAFSPFAQHLIRPLSFSPDGRWILVADASLLGGVAIYDALTGDRSQVVAKTGLGLLGTFSPDGRRFAIWSRYGGEQLLWEMDRPDRPLARLNGAGNEAMKFSPDGRRMITGGKDQRAVLWDADTFQMVGQFQGHTDEIEDVAFSADGRRVATAGRDGTARIWETADLPGPRKLHEPGHSPEIFAAAFSRDGRHLATAGIEFAEIRETATGKLVHRLRVYQPVRGKVRQWQEEYVESVGFSPDGRRLVAAGNNSVAIVFDVASGRPLLTLDNASTNQADRRIRSAVFSPDGRQIVTMNHLQVKTWDAESGELLHTRIYTKTNGLHTIPPVGFTPDGRRLYCASIQEVTMWDAATGEEVFHLPLENAAMMNAQHPTIAFSPDGTSFALHCVKWNGAIQIHDAASGRLVRTLAGHRERVMSLDFSPDSARLLSGGMDQTVKLWHWRSGRELLSFKAPHGIACVRFAPDGRRIFAGGLFDHGLVWEAAAPDQVAAWEAKEATEAMKWAAMTEEFVKRRAAGWAADDASRKARRAAIEQATAEKLARLGDPARHGKAPGAIQQWLVLLPPDGSFIGEIQLDEEQIPGEARIRPRARELMRLGKEERAWTPIQLANDRLDIHKAVQSGERSTVAYAVSYLLSDRDQSGLLLKVGSDYHAKIYLNEREIYRCVNPPTIGPDRDTVTGVELKAGLNVLVFKVVKAGIYDDTLGWSGSVRFTAADGSPATGLAVTLDPDAKK
jgi:WD40 repeat protein/tRNA A-37 threonylcarbamoyl transferase component Bud32